MREIKPTPDSPLVRGLDQGHSNWWWRLQNELGEACIYESPHSVLNLLNRLASLQIEYDAYIREHERLVAERK